LKRWHNLFASRSQETSGIGKTLQALPFFSHCGRGELHRLELLIYQRSYGSGELVCACSSPGNALYIVQTGLLECRGSIQKSLGAGEFFGAEGLFAETRYKQDVAALEETTLLVLFRHDLERFAQRYPETACRILSAFSRFFAGQVIEDPKTQEGA
jgi:CRP-like cAMP-binding protein